MCYCGDEWLCLLEGGEEKFRTAVLVQDVAIFLGKHHSRTISFPLLKASRLIVHHQEQKLECPQNLKCSRVSSPKKREKRGSTGGGHGTLVSAQQKYVGRRGGRTRRESNPRPSEESTERYEGGRGRGEERRRRRPLIGRREGGGAHHAFPMYFFETRGPPPPPFLLSPPPPPFLFLPPAPARRWWRRGWRHTQQREEGGGGRRKGLVGWGNHLLALDGKKLREKQPSGFLVFYAFRLALAAPAVLCSWELSYAYIDSFPEREHGDNGVWYNTRCWKSWT